MAGDVLLPELLTEILSRLPVKSLLRFRSTSKSLKSIIDSHNFTNLHLKNNSLNFNLILQLNTDLYQLDLPNLTKSMIPLNHPFSTNIAPVTRNSNMGLIGSCNGLIAISYGQIAFRDPNGPNEITIWNPNTRKHRIIPFLPLAIPNILESDNIHRFSLCVHGFGFDPLSGDYKLLRIAWIADPNERSSFVPHVRLFNSKTNSWKIIPAMPYALVYAQNTGVLVENSLHWIMTKKLGVHKLVMLKEFLISMMLCFLLEVLYHLPSLLIILGRRRIVQARAREVFLSTGTTSCPEDLN